MHGTTHEKLIPMYLIAALIISNQVFCGGEDTLTYIVSRNVFAMSWKQLIKLIENAGLHVKTSEWKGFHPVLQEDFFQFVAEEHETKLIWIFCIWWSICSSWRSQVSLLDFFLFWQLSAPSGWNNSVLLVLVAETQGTKIWNDHLKLFFRFQKNLESFHFALKVHSR